MSEILLGQKNAVNEYMYTVPTSYNGSVVSIYSFIVRLFVLGAVQLRQTKLVVLCLRILLLRIRFATFIRTLPWL